MLICNAGAAFGKANVCDADVDDFERTMRLNVTAPFVLTRFALSHLQKTKVCIQRATGDDH